MIAAIIFVIYKDRQSSFQNTSNLPIEEEKPRPERNKIMGDFNNDGKLERAIVYIAGEDESTSQNYIAFFDEKGKEIFRSPEWMTFPNPVEEEIEALKLKTSKNKSFLKLEFLVGPHQTEIMFIGIDEEHGVTPICKNPIEKVPEDCLFYSTHIGGIQIGDLDDDDFIEVVEYVDDYSDIGQISKEEETAIEEGFGEAAEEAKQIVLREQGGRGKGVVWGIYRFDGGRKFNPLSGKDFLGIFNSLAKEQPDLMKKSEMTKESIEYIESTRKFWTHRE